MLFDDILRMMGNKTYSINKTFISIGMDLMGWKESKKRKNQTNLEWLNRCKRCACLCLCNETIL